ncbi:MAG: hypothetical protein OXN24_05505, partial [Candidatus Dadabacteria bacterium]|nr:hypothetical protein [Candidatus Dadabacteria bacterium]
DEPDETVTIALGAAPAGATRGTPDSAVVTLRDNDPTVVTLSVPDPAAREGSATATARIAVTLSRALTSGETVTVPLSFAGGTAGTDFDLALPCPAPAGVALAGSTVTFTGPSAAAVSLVLTARTDADTTDDVVTVSLGAVSESGLVGGGLGTHVRTGDGEITLFEADGATRTDLTITPDAASVTEGTAAGFTLAADPAPANDLAVALTVSQGGAFLAATGSTLTVTLPGGMASAAVTVPTDDDARDEPDGWVEVAVQPSLDAYLGDYDPDADGDYDDYAALYDADRHYPYDVGTPASARITVSDNDDPPLTVTVAPKTPATPVAEGTGAAFTVTVSAAPAAALTVHLAVEDAPHADFVAPANEGNQTVTIAAGDTTAELIVPTTGGSDESTDEPDGPVTVTVSADPGAPPRYAPGAPAAAQVTVTDDDATTSALAGSDAALAEGAARTFTLTLGRALTAGEGLVIPLAFTGTATRGADYTTACPDTPPAGVACADLNNTGTGNNPRVTFTGRAAGSAAGVTLTLTAVADAVTEADGETLNVNPGTPAATGLGGGADATADHFGELTLTDPPGAPTVSLGSAAYRAVEGEAARITLSIAPTRNAVTAVPLTCTDATATGGTDYTCRTSVTIPANGNAASFDIATTEDAADEPDETFTLAIDSANLPAGVVAGSPAAATVTITDDDEPPPVLTVTGGNPVTEGGRAAFTVRANPAPANALTVHYALTDAPGADFLSPATEAGATWTFPAGAASVTYTVATVADAADEPDGPVTATLLADEQYALGDPHTARVTVRDDDPGTTDDTDTDDTDTDD